MRQKGGRGDVEAASRAPARDDAARRAEPRTERQGLLAAAGRRARPAPKRGHRAARALLPPMAMAPSAPPLPAQTHALVWDLAHARLLQPLPLEHRPRARIAAATVQQISSRRVIHTRRSGAERVIARNQLRHGLDNLVGVPQKGWCKYGLQHRSKYCGVWCGRALVQHSILGAE